MGLSSRYNYYEILELSPNAAPHEVTTAYERAKNTYSGDNPAIYTIFSPTEARQLLEMVEEAFSVLGNKTYRTIYDQRLMSGSFNQKELTFDSIVLASKQMFPEPKDAKKLPLYKKDENFEHELAQVKDWSGQWLKRLREYRSITIEKMTEITKINPFYIAAIEEMEPQNLPAAVFIRGYVIQIAKTLGLDSKAVADSYMTLLKNVEVKQIKPLE